MTHRYDGSSIDIEKQLVRYMIEHKLTRRMLLERIAKVGAVTALAPIVAACTGGGATASPSAASAPPPPTGSAAPPSEAAAPTPVPEPEAELFVYNWTEYIGEDVVPSFEEKYGVKVTYDFFSTRTRRTPSSATTAAATTSASRSRSTSPTSSRRGAVDRARQVAHPEPRQPRRRMGRPGYDPGNAHSVPYMWWTTGVGYDTSRITDALTSSTALWDERWAGHISMLDDWQEAFALALIQLGYSANTESTAELDEALALLERQKPLVRTYTTDTITAMSSGDHWIGHIWGADLYQISQENENIAYYVPEEGGVKGSDTLAIFSGAQHPIAAHLFINYLLDAEISASNTNYIGYMGPNAAAKEFIDPAILDDPAVNPDQAIVDKLQELLDLDQAVRDEYLDRWQSLRGG